MAVAVAENPAPGGGIATVAGLNGATGSFQAGASGVTSDDLRAKGTIVHDGDQYLSHAGDGSVFLKSGVGAPENFLAYSGFDNTPDSHDYAPRKGAFRPGDPTWGAGDDSEGIIGAVNYLADQGVNSLYFMAMNVGGDGRDIWPWAEEGLRNGGSVVEPRGTGDNDAPAGATFPAGASGNGFFKVYSSGARDWSWSARTSDSDARVLELADGIGVDPGLLSQGLFSIEAVPGTGMDVASVQLRLGDGPDQIENVAPYALFGDRSGDFAGEALPLGARTITASFFTGADATGTAGGLQLDFTVEEPPGPPVNTAPIAADDSATTLEDTAVTIDVLANDADVDDLAAALSVDPLDAPTKGSVAVVGGQAVYTPAAGASGTDGFVYQAVDPSGALSAPAAVAVEIGTPTAPRSLALSFADAESDATLAPLVAGATTALDDLAGPRSSSPERQSRAPLPGWFYRSF